MLCVLHGQLKSNNVVCRIVYEFLIRRMKHIILFRLFCYRIIDSGEIKIFETQTYTLLSAAVQNHGCRRVPVDYKDKVHIL